MRRLIVLRKYSSVLQTTGFNNILLAENQYQCSLTTSLNERNIGARPEKAPDYTLKKGGKASLKSITMVFRTATDTEMADIIMRKPCGRFVLQMVCSLCKRKIIICKGTDFIRKNGNNRIFINRLCGFSCPQKGCCKTNVAQIPNLSHTNGVVYQPVA